MSDLSELYYRYSNFTQYRNEVLNAVDEENDSIKLQVKKLELEKQQAILDFDKKINDLKSTMSTTNAKNRKNQELNQEKKDLKEQLHQEIALQYNHGMKPQEIANLLNLSSTTLIYQAIKSTNTTVKRDAVDHSNMWDELEWEYFTNPAIHRYAVSSDGKFVKVHGVDSKYKIIDAVSMNHVSGDTDVKVQKSRVVTALEMFNGTYEGKVVERENPYSNGS